MASLFLNCLCMHGCIHMCYITCWDYTASLVWMSSGLTGPGQPVTILFPGKGHLSSSQVSPAVCSSSCRIEAFSFLDFSLFRGKLMFVHRVLTSGTKLSRCKANQAVRLRKADFPLLPARLTDPNTAALKSFALVPRLQFLKPRVLFVSSSSGNKPAPRQGWRGTSGRTPCLHRLISGLTAVPAPETTYLTRLGQPRMPCPPSCWP